MMTISMLGLFVGVLACTEFAIAYSYPIITRDTFVSNTVAAAFTLHASGCASSISLCTIGLASSSP